MCGAGDGVTRGIGPIAEALTYGIGPAADMALAERVPGIVEILLRPGAIGVTGGQGKQSGDGQKGHKANHAPSCRLHDKIQPPLLRRVLCGIAYGLAGGVGAVHEPMARVSGA
jgi:hypothetical protein